MTQKITNRAIHADQQNLSPLIEKWKQNIFWVSVFALEKLSKMLKNIAMRDVAYNGGRVAELIMSVKITGEINLKDHNIWTTHSGEED